MAVIQGRINLMRCGSSPDPALGGHIESIAGSIRTMAGLTRKLLAYGRGGNYQPVGLDLNDFVKSNLPALTRGIPDGIRVDTRLDEPMPSIVADPAQLRLVLSELISNAVEALEAAGNVAIETLNR